PPAQSLPPARALLPPLSASPRPGRPPRSRPPPDVDSPAPAAFLADVARPLRALHVAASPCQEVTASTAARRARPRETVALVSSREGTVSREPCPAALRESRGTTDMCVGRAACALRQNGQSWTGRR